MLAVDTETEGFEFYDPAFCVTTADGHRGGFYDLDREDDLRAIRAVLQGAESWIFHNAKFDLQKLILAGVISREDVTPTRFEDTNILAYLANEHRRNGLKPLARDLLGEETDEEEVLRKVRRQLKLKKDDGYHLLPREVLEPYALKDAEFTFRLYPILVQELHSMGDPQLWELYAMEKELTLVLLDMETAGLRVDLDYADTTAKEYGRKAVMTEMEIRDLTGDEEFNPQSNPQIKEAFAARGIESEKFDKHVLSELDDPLGNAILTLRSTRKLHGTYLLPILHEAQDGILHPNYRMNRTRTGRLASGGVEAD